MRLKMRSSLLVFGLSLLTGCGLFQGDTGKNGADFSKEENNLSVLLNTDKEVYFPGEMISLICQIKNSAMHPLEISNFLGGEGVLIRDVQVIYEEKEILKTTRMIKSGNAPLVIPRGTLASPATPETPAPAGGAALRGVLNEYYNLCRPGKYSLFFQMERKGQSGANAWNGAIRSEVFHFEVRAPQKPAGIETEIPKDILPLCYFSHTFDPKEGKPIFGLIGMDQGSGFQLLFQRNGSFDRVKGPAGPGYLGNWMTSSQDLDGDKYPEFIIEYVVGEKVVLQAVSLSGKDRRPTEAGHLEGVLLLKGERLLSPFSLSAEETRRCEVLSLKSIPDSSGCRPVSLMEEHYRLGSAGFTCTLRSYASTGRKDRFSAEGRYLPMQFRPVRQWNKLVVMILDGDPSTETRRESAGLDAILRGIVGNTGVVTLSPADLRESDLKSVDVCFLVNVEGLGKSGAKNDATSRAENLVQVQALERFVSLGGALVIVPGSRSSTDWLNGYFWAGGAGLLPLPYQAKPPRPTTHFLSETSPLLASRKLEESALKRDREPVAATLFALEAAARECQILLSAGETPLVARYPFDLGQVYQFAIPIGGGLSTLDKQKIFSSLVIHLLTDISAGGPWYNAAVAEPPRAAPHKTN